MFLMHGIVCLSALCQSCRRPGGRGGIHGQAAAAHHAARCVHEPDRPPGPAPHIGAKGTAQLDIGTTRGTIYTRVQFTGTGTPTPVPPGVPCKEVWPSNGIRLYVVAGDNIIGSRNLPPPTCNTVTDTWAASSQVMQAIVANPSNAIVYVQAPPGNPGSPQSLPGGVVLNPGSPWAWLQAVPSGGGANV